MHWQYKSIRAWTFKLTPDVKNLEACNTPGNPRGTPGKFNGTQLIPINNKAIKFARKIQNLKHESKATNRITISDRLQSPNGS